MFIENPYENFIHKSRYARWLEDEGRRENWDETVNRYVDFMVQDLRMRHDYTAPPELVAEVRHAILNRDVLPSMRSLMTAGPPLARENVAGYNCAFLAVDDPRAFDEALYILMNGTGVGFSVESQFVEQLPAVPESLSPGPKITVADSKLGWAVALQKVVEGLYDGVVHDWDLSLIRPAGSRLRTFGGRASGPEPLNELLNFVVKVFVEARGRKITPLEAHEIMCKIGQVVVVGGVRRSALISLSDLNDEDVRDAKHGEFWNEKPHLSLSNNSAVYDQKPSREEFDAEFDALIASGSGERGIFSRYGAKDRVRKFGRNAHKIVGTNPSLVPGTKVWTSEGVVPIEQLEGKEFYVRNLNGNISLATCWQSGSMVDVFDINLEGGHSYGATPQHKWPVWNGSAWERRTTEELRPGDKLPNLRMNSMFPLGTEGTREEGFLIGWNLGDGWQTSREKGLQIGFIVSDEDRESAIDQKLEKILFALGSRASFEGKSEINVNNVELRKLFVKYGVKHKSVGLPDAMWDANVSDDFRRGVIDGLFSSDGNIDPAGRIGLVQASEALIDDVSSVLGFFGIKTSKLKRTTTGRKAFGEHSAYAESDKTFVSFHLRVGGMENVQRFAECFHLSHNRKQAMVDGLAARRRSKGEPKDWFVEVVSVTERGQSDVWDISVFDDTHAFQIDHVVTGNCGEILLRSNQFCNLSTVTIRPGDDQAELARKVRLATVIGTWQSTLTDFNHLRPIWRHNTEEERLLGVSLNGIFGNELTNGKRGNLESLLNDLRTVARIVNDMEAHAIGISPSAAITTVKPEGTTSQLTGVASGGHPWHDEYYIRNVRGDIKDPLSQFLIEQGVPNAVDTFNPKAVVFSFPVAAPRGAVTRNELSAIQHLEIWKTYSQYWTDHNPSITVNVRADEWGEVREWVWNNFDSITGVSFLPFDDHVYVQAPYETVDQDKYEFMLNVMPDVDWDEFQKYESEDTTKGSQELACVAGGCSVDYI
jgi:ribonucleotide reductase, class II